MPSVHSTSVWSSSFAFQIAFKTRNFYFSNVVVLILKTFNLLLEKIIYRETIRAGMFAPWSYQYQLHYQEQEVTDNGSLYHM